MNKCARCKSPTDRRVWCKPCTDQYNRDYRVRNRDRLLKKSAVYRATNLEKIKTYRDDYYRRNVDRVKAAVKAYCSENPEKLKARRAAYHIAHAEKARASAKAWKSKNPERSKELKRIACLNRIARIKGAEGSHNAEDIRRLYEIQGGKCNICFNDISEGYEVDHMNPISRGGGNGPDNLQLLCSPCNRSKGAKTMAEFIEAKSCRC